MAIPSSKIVEFARPVGWRLEEFWLGLLPSLTRDYRWAAAGGLQFFGSSHHQKKLALMQRGSYEPFTVHLFREVLRPGMVVVDLGAYVGYYTLLAARSVGQQGRVYAFESDPRSYRFLVHNVRLNKCRNVRPIPKAVMNQVGVRPFFLYSGDLTRSSLWDQHAAERSVEIECTTVDEALGERTIQVLKADIEGGELHALQGMERTLRNSDQVTLFVECNPSALSAAGASVDALLDWLERFGFHIQVIDETERRLVPVSNAIRITRNADGKRNYCNLYCRRRG